jgi:hypothetical protein
MWGVSVFRKKISNQANGRRRGCSVCCLWIGLRFSIPLTVSLKPLDKVSMSGSDSGALSNLPSMMEWGTAGDAMPEAKQIRLEPSCMSSLRLKAPWWLDAKRNADAIEVCPRVRGLFSGSFLIWCGEQLHRIQVRSVLERTSRSKWEGAGTAFAGTLGASLPVILISPLLSVYIVGTFLSFLLVPAIPLLQLAFWGGKIGGRTFLMKMLCGWLAAVLSFFGIMYLLSSIQFRDFNLLFSKQITVLHFLVVAGPGACAGAIWGFCLNGRRLGMVGAITGCLYPAATVFATHWCALGVLPRELEGFFLGGALVSPVLLSSAWIGSRLPPARLQYGILSRRMVAGGLGALAAVFLLLGWMYNAQKPSAIKVRRLEMNRSIVDKKNSENNDNAVRTIWELELIPSWSVQAVISPRQEIVSFLAGAIYEIDADEMHYVETRGTDPFRALAFTADGSFYCASQSTLVSMKNGQKMWSRGVKGPIFDLQSDNLGNVVCVTEGEVISWDREARERWRSSERRTEYGFLRAVLDRSGNIYVASLTGRTILALNGKGKVIWSQDTGISHPSFLSEPNTFEITADSKEVLIIASETGCVVMDLVGAIIFSSNEPFKVFGCQEQACYGTDRNGAIIRMRVDGSKQVLYTPDTLILGNPVFGTGGNIHILTKGNVTTLNRSGEILNQLSVPREIVRLLAITPKRVYATTVSSLRAMENLPPAKTDIRP